MFIMMKTADFSSTQYSCPSHAYGAVMLSETLLKEDKPNRDRKKNPIWTGRSMSVNAAIHHSSRNKFLNFRCLQNTAKKVHSLRVGRRAFQGLGAEPETALKPNCFSWALPPTLTMHKHDCEEERKGLTGEDNSSGDTLHHH